MRTCCGVIVVALVAAACSGAVVVEESSSDSEGSSVESSSTARAAPTTDPSTTAPPTTVPSTTAAPTTVPPRSPVVLGFAGDSAFTNGLETRDPFGQITDLLSRPDFMVINLETAVADPNVGSPPVAKQFLFRSPPAALDLVVAAGIDGVTLGNNHALDFGAAALEQTLDELDARGIARVGAGRTEQEAYEPLIVDVGDWTIGIVSFSRVPCDWSASGENVRPQIAWACPPFQDQADATVLRAIEQSDVTIVAVHGGEEGVLCPSDFMVELEEHWAELGADVVIDGHPHVLQGLTTYGETLVAHSTGNFAFPPARGISANSAIIEVLVSEGGVELRIVPVRADGGVLRPPTDDQRVEIIDQMNRYSRGVLVEPDGSVTVDSEAVGDCG